MSCLKWRLTVRGRRRSFSCCYTTVTGGRADCFFSGHGFLGWRRGSGCSTVRGTRFARVSQTPTRRLSRRSSEYGANFSRSCWTFLTLRARCFCRRLTTAFRQTGCNRRRTGTSRRCTTASWTRLCVRLCGYTNGSKRLCVRTF